MAGDAAAKQCRYPKKRRPSGEFLRGRSCRCWHWRARSAFSSPTSERRSDNKLGPFRSLFVRPYKVYCLAKCNNGTSIHSPSGSEKIVFVRSYSARAIFFLQKVYRFVSSLRRRDSRRSCHRREPFRRRSDTVPPRFERATGATDSKFLRWKTFPRVLQCCRRTRRPKGPFADVRRLDLDTELGVGTFSFCDPLNALHSFFSLFLRSQENLRMQQK